MPQPLPPQYDPTRIERELYREWEAAGLFTPHPPRAGESPPFVIMMPPPNVTAVLHMGHGLNNTLQDTLIRFERMRGRNTLWLPGTDHAGIATQNVVEKILAREGKTRFDIGRAAFEARVWEHVKKTGPVIIDQLKAIGASADWTRTYFTLDPALSAAVRETFIRLHQKGLIYRGKYIINWCPRCGTALSNEEAEKTDTDGHLWHFQYPLADGSGHLTVATTRPETILGDTGVAVHPADERYRDLVGQQLVLPVVGRLIPIVTDDAIDPAFGSGAVKVTPAHDPVDFEIGRRHDLPAIEVMQADGRMSADLPAPYANADRFAARKLIIAEFDRLGLLEKVESHRHAVGHCYRCDTVVEPRLSEQWFVKMAPLARPALAAYRSGELRFIPERRGEEYAQWMENIRDWCISRQLWWGHRIPVWYCDDAACGAMRVSRTDLTFCPACGGPVHQDEDVLDTWFSSWLVPMSSLGWPEDTPDLAAFFPGDTLVTAPEILFFWVARMVMAALEFRGRLPFTTVYLHGTVRDTDKRKMSKSLGNGIDPLDVVEKYGADALRYTIVAGMSVGTDLILDPEDLEQSFAPGRNFANKLWNAGRFLLGNLTGPTRPLAGAHRNTIRRDELALADRWIIARCEATVTEATLAYERYRLNDAAALVYHFVWSDLADWYIEQIKPRLYGDQPGGDVARAVARRTFEIALQLLHPVMPFITETLWRQLPGRTAGDTLVTSAWPRSDRRALDHAALGEFGLVQELIGAVRAIRAEYNIPPGQLVKVIASNPHPAFEAERGTIERLSKSNLSFGAQPAGPGASAVLSDGSTLFIALGEVINLGQERARLGQEAERLRALVASQEKKLANEQFVSRAPVEVVAREREKLASWGDQLRALEQKLSSLGRG
jgi:valyl-tRNA synthetase